MINPFSGCEKSLTARKFSMMRQACLLVLFCLMSLTGMAQGGEPQVDILNSWVEDGYIFHIDFKVQSYAETCRSTGAGYIGFNVFYQDTRSQEVDWTFGLAPWPGGYVPNVQGESHLTAYGPQAFCTRFSPCTIKRVQMVKTWCPILE